ncbi:integrase [Bacillus sp. CGMCC 1.16607]|uniref:integrase n=1 Tax=Bacillus sp. CGMCC 1.16607 TaxID=3351842 RepID=UPI0036323524
MTRRGKVGVTYEVDQALKKINRIGQGKRDSKAQGDKGNIHSLKQNNHDYKNCNEYGKWLRSERGKGLYQANKTDYKDYIDYKASTGVSKGHLINIETSLRHLSKGMNKVSESRGKASKEWLPRERVISSNEREKPQDRSYSPREVQSIRDNLPSGSKVHGNFTVQNAFGLRLEESAKARVSNFETRGNTTYFVASVGNKITKGARPRETPCRPEYENQVRALISGRSSDSYVGAKYNTARDAYRSAAAKGGVSSYNGSHGYRHSYARAQLNDRLDQKGIGHSGRQVIDRMVANYEAGNRKDTGFTKDEKALYNQVNAVIDSIHADLGHGKGRIDLVAVYMK